MNVYLLQSFAEESKKVACYALQYSNITLLITIAITCHNSVYNLCGLDYSYEKFFSLY
jgi:hypothetical protein